MTLCPANWNNWGAADSTGSFSILKYASKGSCWFDYGRIYVERTRSWDVAMVARTMQEKCVAYRGGSVPGTRRTCTGWVPRFSYDFVSFGLFWHVIVNPGLSTRLIVPGTGPVEAGQWDQFDCESGVTNGNVRSVRTPKNCLFANTPSLTGAVQSGRQQYGVWNWWLKARGYLLSSILVSIIPCFWISVLLHVISALQSSCGNGIRG